jgi:hypothetical protein
MQKDTPQAIAFNSFAENVIKEVKNRNENLSPTKIVEITNSSGCSTN